MSLASFANSVCSADEAADELARSPRMWDSLDEQRLPGCPGGAARGSDQVGGRAGRGASPELGGGRFDDGAAKLDQNSPHARGDEEHKRIGAPRQMGGVQACADKSARAAASTSPGAAQEIDEDSIVIEGPMEEHKFLWLWRPRWCVLDGEELRIYRSREDSRRHPRRPKRVIRVSRLDIMSLYARPAELLCFDWDVSRVCPVATLRTGQGHRWEEVAAARLWIAKVASVIC